MFNVGGINRLARAGRHKYLYGFHFVADRPLEQRTFNPIIRHILASL